MPEIPVIKDIHQKVLEAVTATPDALDMRDWHTCETTHCRAGWVVHLAGKAGYDLEKFYYGNTAFAAQQIYHKSGYDISPVRFYESNEKALADIKRCADVEQAG